MLPLGMFANPAFLFGLAASAIPVIIHLTWRKRSREVLFPSLKFLTVSARRTARRKRVTELLLLLLRCAMLALLAVALAGPFLRAAAIPGTGAPSAVAIILDNSLSMNARAGAMTRLDLAKRAAERILSGLPDGRARAGIFPAGGATDGPGLGALGRPSDARAALASISVWRGRADLSAAARLAVSALDGSGDAVRELYVLTDMQRATLKDLPAVLEGVKRENVAACVVPIEPGIARNAAIVALDIRSRGNLVGAPFGFEASVRNFDTDPADIAVELTVDGERVASRTVKVAGGGTASVSFGHVFRDTGWHEGFASLPSDCLPDDDRRFFAVEARSTLPVLLVEAPASSIEFRNASYYLARALDPAGAAVAGSAKDAFAGSGIRPSLIAPDSLAAEDLSKYRAIFWINPSTPSANVAARVRDFVTAGGCLVVFPGEATRGPEFTAMLGASDRGGPLPASIGDRFGDPSDREKFLNIRDVAFESAAMAPFRGTDRSAFEGVRVHAGFELSLPRAGTSEPLLTLNDGRPFLCRGPFGSGEVYLFCSTPDGVWTNFPLKQVFLPMMHVICHRAAGEGGEAAKLSTGRVRLRLSDKEDIEGELFRPGEPAPVKIATRAGEMLEFEAERPGIYLLRWKSPRPGERRIAVNVEPAESDPAAMGEDELRKAFSGFGTFLFQRDVSALDETVARIREGLRLGPLLMALVLVLAVAESFLANRFRGWKAAESPEREIGTGGRATGAGDLAAGTGDHAESNALAGTG
ncbi:MAG: BatA domain-containing protein [Planctomycetota bacterium]|nr:BatA domain-containing protein [Planctomycetota bacterium]